MNPVPKPTVKPKSRKVKAFAELRQPEYLVFIRTLPCVAKDHPDHHCVGAVQACHLKSRAAGGADFANAYPGCASLHSEQHQVGIRYFAQEYFGGMLVLKRLVTETLPALYEKKVTS